MCTYHTHVLFLSPTPPGTLYFSVHVTSQVHTTTLHNTISHCGILILGTINTHGYEEERQLSTLPLTPAVSQVPLKSLNAPSEAGFRMVIIQTVFRMVPIFPFQAKTARTQVLDYSK